MEDSKATPKGHGGGGSDEVTGDDPWIKLETAEIARDGGQRCSNHCRIHGRDKERDHKPSHNAIELGRPRNALELNAHVFRLTKMAVSLPAVPDEIAALTGWLTVSISASHPCAAVLW